MHALWPSAGAQSAVKVSLAQRRPVANSHAWLKIKKDANLESLRTCIPPVSLPTFDCFRVRRNIKEHLFPFVDLDNTDIGNIARFESNQPRCLNRDVDFWLLVFIYRTGEMDLRMRRDF